MDLHSNVHGRSTILCLGLIDVCSFLWFGTLCADVVEVDSIVDLGIRLKLYWS